VARRVREHEGVRERSVVFTPCRQKRDEVFGAPGNWPQATPVMFVKPYAPGLARISLKSEKRSTGSRGYRS
jgi:hypothetical protein